MFENFVLKLELFTILKCSASTTVDTTVTFTVEFELSNIFYVSSFFWTFNIVETVTDTVSTIDVALYDLFTFKYYDINQCLCHYYIFSAKHFVQLAFCT